MTDLTLPVALVVSIGLVVTFYVKWRLERYAHQGSLEVLAAAHVERLRLRRDLEATRAALAGKVAAEFSGGDGEGPVAA